MNLASIEAALNGDIENTMIAETPGGIEKQEKEGQLELVTREQMPIDGTENHREELESMGFVFGERIDDIFLEMRLPPNWKKETTDHSMWSSLFDDKNRKRASIFYKAAFYDRSARVSWESRFRIEIMTEDGQDYYDLDLDSGEEILCAAVVIDFDGKEIFSTETQLLVCSSGYNPGNYNTRESLNKEAQEWLNINYPQWNENPFAYWND